MSDHYFKESLDPDYDHRFHAGNIGDVWKHCVLLQLLADLQTSSAAIHLIDGHAGSGEYQLQHTGEWTEGVGRLLERRATVTSPALQRYLQTLAAFDPASSEGRRYPGSPLLLLRGSRPADRLTFIERDPTFAASLRALCSADRRVRVAEGSVEQLLPAAVQEQPGPTIVHIDPPWRAKSDWQNIPRLLCEVWQAAPEIRCALWYPIKSYTRVANMISDLRKKDLPFVALDLITTPLALRRNRLNGSGMLLVNPPSVTVPQLAAAAAELGSACATHSGRWELRVQG